MSVDVIGAPALNAAASEIQSRLDAALKRNYGEDFIDEIYREGLDRLEKIAEEETKKVAERIAAEEEQLRKLYDAKFTAGPNERIYARDKHRVNFELMTAKEFEELSLKVSTGNHVFAEVDQAEQFLLAAKSRAPKQFDILREQMDNLDWRRPWRQLLDKSTRNIEAAVRERPKGYYLAIGPTQKPEIKGCVPAPLDSLISKPKPRTTSDRVSDMFASIKPTSKKRN
jgi:disulfide oxidoreductase YuzD